MIDLGFGYTDEQRMIRETTLRMCKPFEANRQAFERDRERDSVLQLAGYRVIRITWRRLERESARSWGRFAAAVNREHKPSSVE